MFYYLRDLKKQCDAMQIKCVAGDGKLDVRVNCSLDECLMTMQQIGVQIVFCSFCNFSNYYISEKQINSLTEQDKIEKCRDYNQYIKRLSENVLEKCFAVYNGKIIGWQLTDDPLSTSFYLIKNSSELHLSGHSVVTGETEIFKKICSGELDYDYKSAAQAFDENSNQ